MSVPTVWASTSQGKDAETVSSENFKYVGDDASEEVKEAQRQALEDEEKRKKKQDEEIRLAIEESIARQETAMQNTLNEIMRGAAYVRKEKDN